MRRQIIIKSLKELIAFLLLLITLIITYQGLPKRSSYDDSGGTLNNYDTLQNDSGGTLLTLGMYTQINGLITNNGSMGKTSIQINGGTLIGTGTITGNVAIGSGATVKTGNTPGTMTVNGTFSSSGNIETNFINNYVPSAGNFYFNVNGLPAGNPYEFKALPSSERIKIESVPTPTPIPATVYLFGSGLLCLVCIRRKMQNNLSFVQFHGRYHYTGN